MKGITYVEAAKNLDALAGKRKSLCLDDIESACAFDIGRLITGRYDKITEFNEFLGSSEKGSFTLLSAAERKEILIQLGSDSADDEGESSEKRRMQREYNALFSRLYSLKKDCEEMALETGRNELFIGYPFVFANASKKGYSETVKAPLLLFPVLISFPNDKTAEIIKDTSRKVRINRLALTAYKAAKKGGAKKNLTEYLDYSEFSSVEEIISYLANQGVKIEYSPTKNIYPYSLFKEPIGKNEFSARGAAVIARFPLSDLIYEDYLSLAAKKDKSDAIVSLFSEKKEHKSFFSFLNFLSFRKKDSLYTIKNPDHAEREALLLASRKGNTVICAPPGTEDSAAIANLITDSVAKGKRILVCSGKKPILDSVYSSIGDISEKCAYIVDEASERQAFYEKLFAAHKRSSSTVNLDEQEIISEHLLADKKIENEEGKINSLFAIFSKPRPFGISLADMYEYSYRIPEGSEDFALYKALLSDKAIMAMNYPSLFSAVSRIEELKLEKIFYSYMLEKRENPVLSLLLTGLDKQTLIEVGYAFEKARAAKPYFNAKDHPYYRQVLAYYNRLDNTAIIDGLVKTESRASGSGKKKSEIREEILATAREIKEISSLFDCLHKVVDENGYVEILDNLLSGLPEYPRLVREALDRYSKIQELEALFESSGSGITDILGFAYKSSRDYEGYRSAIRKVLPLRIYREALFYENAEEAELLGASEPKSYFASIIRETEKKRELAIRLTDLSSVNEYSKVFAATINRDAYLNAISSPDVSFKIYDFITKYESLVFRLIPVWILSPENVANLLPLKKNLFDTVIIDEAASRIIEQMLPTLYRAKSAVYVGDTKQASPTAVSVRRTFGYKAEENEKRTDRNYESLMALAERAFPSAALVYHYGTHASELIEFSNKLFYSSELKIAPRLKKQISEHSIESNCVFGLQDKDGRNLKEAERVIEILEELSKAPEDSGSLGILTLGEAQKLLILELIDKKMSASPPFREFILRKRRIKSKFGAPLSFFVKTVENACGETRDTVIFSTVFSKNKKGDAVIDTNFLPLKLSSVINVAITAAASKFITVTSLAAEDLSSDESENGRLLAKFLTYTEAYSSGNKNAIKAASALIDQSGAAPKRPLLSFMPSIEEQIKARLTELGYKVELGLGNKNCRISLAIYDKKKDRFSVGIIVDSDALLSSDSTLEREIYFPHFLELMGWTVIRVTCREWWQDPEKVLADVISLAKASGEQKENV